ncbi:hypothetical protein CBR_g68178 [Chara braunii]|uniref:Uncharacterized protein n=1 Tax=Chara braunii TaxID=69332 RepID=A0A388MFZ0_CHABU|nr:hypothetical protein CBR_g68178 [Chara braunii]|eukprot:GBG93395.1 hypothetical protein CBR_g68178 [Chara braunii]
MAQRWNSDSEGNDSDGSDSDGAPIERWRNDGTNIAMADMVPALRWRNDGTNVAMADMVPALRWRSDGQRCDESDVDCQRCDGQASMTAAMGDIALRRDGDELSASITMVYG